MNPGTKLGPYQITSQLGAGGMGEVYRATDTRLDRTVAIKVLPEHLASDPGRRERFEREAKAVSSLNHPHICTLHDVGVADGTHYLVMELVEGETLEARLARGRLEMGQALEYAVQTADALDKAHRQGVVHRDLKPGNIMLTKAGVKLLDFGLAKLKGDASPTSGLSQAPTQENLTAEGTILGTLQYMAPEQLEGEEADSRTDIFAFGAVVYEMVTGKKAFEGKSQASLIGAIMNSEPQPMGELEAMTPRLLDRLVRQCLSKDPNERWQTSGDLMRELMWIRESGADIQRTTGGPTSSRAVSQMMWMALASLTLLAIVLGILAFRPAPPLSEMRVDIMTPPTPEPGSMAISPDGTQIVFVGFDEGIAKLMLRRLGTEWESTEALEGTENPRNPFWSPDSRHIGFWADNFLKSKDLQSGVVRDIARVDATRGAWGGEDTILLPVRGDLHLVSATGGEPIPLELEPQDVFMQDPSFLPSGDRFLAYSRPTRQVFVGELGTSEMHPLLEADSTATFASAQKKLLYVSQDTLYARDFDPESLALGEAQTVVVDDIFHWSLGRAVWAAETGILAYRTRAATPAPQFVWFDRSGSILGAAAQPSGAMAGALELSLDDRYVAFEQESVDDGIMSIYSLDLERSTFDRITSGAVSGDAQPTWSPDNALIAFFRFDRSTRLYFATLRTAEVRDVSGSADIGVMPTDWSQDGEYLLLNVTTANISAIGTVEISDSEPIGDPIIIVDSEGNDEFAQFSPDGNWIAYESDRQGPRDIYLARFPDPGSPTRITNNGGTQVRWGPNGDELFYIRLDGAFMSVPIQLPSSSSGEPEVGNEEQLFTAPTGFLQFRGQQYDVSSDGQRFLMIVPPEGNSAITLLQNWNPGSE